MRFSRESYIRIFDALLSEELCYSSVAATEENIKAAIKRVLGKAIKANSILLYHDLKIDDRLNVYFTITDPDGDRLPLKLTYGE